MNPSVLVDVLARMLAGTNALLPWYVERRHACLSHRKYAGQWFRVPLEFYDSVQHLYDEIFNCHAMLMKYEAACKRHRIKGER